MLGASLLSVGVSNATGTSIKACAKKSNGAMRLIDVSKKCKKSERTLTWGTQGSAGATGATGPEGTAGATGATGATGSNGLSTAYAFTNSQTNLVYAQEPLTIVTAQSLPAGSYVWSHSMEVSFVNPTIDGSASLPDAESNNLACWISRSEDPLYPVEDAVWPDPTSSVPFRSSFPDVLQSVNDFEHAKAFAVSGAIELTQPTNLYFRCAFEGAVSTPDNASYMALRYPSLVFTRVNELLP